MPIDKNYKQISITRLILNPENDRFEPVEDEKQALEMMLNKLGSKIYVLAADIAKRGLSRKPFYVIPYNNKYLVKDGNRRTTAIKLLARPKLINEKKYPILRKRFEKLHDIYIQHPIKSILCYVFPNSLYADSWVELEHLGEQKGLGTVKWDSEPIHRFNQKHGKNPPIQIQAMDFIRNSAFISDDVKEQSKTIELTNFERFINDTNIRKLLGFSWLNSQLISDVEESEIAKGLSRVICEMSNPQFTVKSIYTAEDRNEFIHKWKDYWPNLSKKVPIWSLSGIGETDDTEEEVEYNLGGELINTQQKLSSDNFDDEGSEKKKPINKGGISSKNIPIPVKRKTIIPIKCVIRITNPKVNKLYKELQILDIYKLPNCGAIALRVFIELGIDTYLEEYELLGEGKVTAAKSGKPLHEKIAMVRNHLKQRKLSDDAISKGIATMLKEEDSESGLSTLHAYVHSNRFAAIPENLITAWDNIQDFMVILWTEIEKEIERKKERQ